MGPYLWCAVGAVLGLLAAQISAAKGIIPMIESAAVGAFGAGFGGEFLPQMLFAPQAAGAGFDPARAGLAILCAVVSLALLMVMRRAVGPMKPHAKKRRPS